MTKSRQVYWFLIAAAFCALALHSIDRPLVGNFAGRSIPYAMFAKNYLLGSPFYHPTADILVDGQKTICFLDFPLVSFFAAALKAAMPFLSLDVLGRLVSIGSVLGSLWALFFIGRKLGLKEGEALLACAFFAFSPLVLIYGQSFQNELISLFLLLVSIFFLLRYHERSRVLDLVFSALLLGLAETARIHYGVILLPVLFFLARKPHPGRTRDIIYYLLISQTLPAAWYGFCYFETLSHTNVIWSIYYQAGTKGLPFQYFLTADFYKTFFKSIFLLAMGGIGVFYFLAGFKESADRKSFFLLGWILCGALIVLFLPKKVIDHNYYLVFLTPPAALCFALGAVIIARRFSFLLLIVFIICSLTISYKTAFGIPEGDKFVVEDGQVVQRVTATKDRILFVGFGPSMMYYSDREGWNLSAPLVLSPYLELNLRQRREEQLLEELKNAKDLSPWIRYVRSQGATYLVVNKPVIKSAKVDLSPNPDSFGDVIHSNSRILVIRLAVKSPSA